MKKFFAVIAAIVLLTSCGVDQKEYDAQVSKVDSLTAVCEQLMADTADLRKELEGYKYAPEKLLASIRENYAAKEYYALRDNFALMHRYHHGSNEYAQAKGIYEQAQKEQKAARKKAQAEAERREAERRAKMKPIERIMEKYDCTQEIAELIHKGRVRIGMTAEQCRASWGRPQDINRTTGSYGVHEQWCYGGHNYLYFEDGILTSIQN